MVELFNQGKPRSEIIREYDLTASAFDKWVRRINTTGSNECSVDKEVLLNKSIIIVWFTTIGAFICHAAFAASAHIK